jgi:hypothetical protein
MMTQASAVDASTIPRIGGQKTRKPENVREAQTAGDHNADSRNGASHSIRLKPSLGFQKQ